MPKYMPATLAIAAMLIASTAMATERSELEKSTVKAATDCVAAAALKDPNITTLYREDRLDEVTDPIVLHSSACDNPLWAMRLLHDRLYGEGTGRTFLRGAYLADLPRAVRGRIRGVFESQATAPLPPANQHRTGCIGLYTLTQPFPWPCPFWPSGLPTITEKMLDLSRR